MHSGRAHAIVFMAEGVKLDPPSDMGPSKALADFLDKHFRDCTSVSVSIDVRHSVLGHLQRGGTPSATDRLLATDFAEAAWEAVTAPTCRSGVLGLVGGRIQLQTFNAAPRTSPDIETQRLYELQKNVS